MDIWAATHRARRALADDLTGIDEAQWRHPTLCDLWDVQHVVAHLTAAATVGRWAWLRSIAASGFSPAVHNDRRLREHLGSGPGETLANFRAVVDSTVAPTGDLPAYLGEVLVHAEDIRVPLGLQGPVQLDAATAVADFYATKNFTVPGKATAAGLGLRATDGPFRAGEGPEVAGPTMALVMTLAGRPSHLDLLSGPGVARLAARVRPGR